MSRKPGRNDPCPCGSGKKYKRCCGAAGAHAASRGAPQEVIPRLVRYAKSDSLRSLYGSALALYMAPLEELDPEEREDLFEEFSGLLQTLDMHFHEWLLADYENPDSGANVIDHYLQHRAWREDARAQAWLGALRRHRLSLYEVQSVRRGQGVTLRDVLRGGEPVEVIERAGSEGLHEWDFLITRIIPFEDECYLSGALLPLSRELGQTLADELPEQLVAQLGPLDAEKWDDFLQGAGPYFMEVFLQPFLEPAPPPELVTAEGDSMCLAAQRFTFDTADREAILARLTARPEIEQDEPGELIWLDPDTLDTDRVRLLGSIEIKDDRGIFETHSRPRLERGRALLEELIGDLVRFLPAEFQDAWRAADERRADEGGEAPVLGPEIKQAMLDEHYANWFDEPIPALDGRTPNEAVETEEGRRAVIALLKDYENNEARAAPPGGRYDFGWMWDELGLERPEDTAAPPPDAGDSEEARAERRELVMEAIELQMADNDPPETRETYDRLRREDHSHDETMNLIGCVLGNEIFEVMRSGRRYDRDRYVAALKNLPALPWDEED
ncbi:MAG: DUF2384 domain-containing protein [Gammaproteobacteria bacterium]|nr:DUF2384 domain-containing protein [Gammaproteobacteria bacterium]NIR98012.1 DUF2384 domain-containing protein [Gammaproteobacteria bacterium]NIT63711.1 DUF2384 domain-containing protein [Gammaproteobacteria bacterium]NIV20675.1 DUF2384 domain-containing protein [Gammaproteobacteria bacterium]NIX11383.1 DUF2384 domain-containing protein [Gammaproteobacteria bacterium]